LESYQRVAEIAKTIELKPAVPVGFVIRNLPLSKKSINCCEPGPVVLLTTASKGRSNIMTMSWHMMVDFERHLLPAWSATGITAMPHCVRRKSASSHTVRQNGGESGGGGNCSGRDVNKFEKFGLTPLPAKTVAAPLVAECFANFECKVADTRLVEQYGIFI